MLLRLCREFHKLPGEIRREDAELLRLLAIEHEGTRAREEVGEHGE